MPRRHEDRPAQAEQDLRVASDVNVLVIFAGLREWMEVCRCSRGLVQPLVWGLNEALEEIAAGNTLLIEALEDGIPLLDREGTHGRLRAAAEKAKGRLGLVREGSGWWRERSV